MLDSREMKLKDVLSVLELFEQNGIEIWLDGGWAVDALLGKQTRPHSDLDIVVEQKYLPKLRKLLEEREYSDVPRDDTSPWNFVLGDGVHEVDIHAVELDKNGAGLYGPFKKGIYFPAGSLTGSAVLGGRKVKCISPEHLVKFHTGYELGETDFKDVTAICDKFGIEYPLEYKNFKVGK